MLGQGFDLPAETCVQPPFTHSKSQAPTVDLDALGLQLGDAEALIDEQGSAVQVGLLCVSALKDCAPERKSVKD